MRATTADRIYGLDVFRAIAIILVVHTHGRYMLKGTLMQGFPWVRLIDGVELFFVLSGFLIGSILINTIFKSGFTLTRGQLLTFWKRRWFRTLPNYYLVLLLNVAFAYWGLNGSHFDKFSFEFLFFLQNFSKPFSHFFWESWSLAIEEWFYILLPLILILTTNILPNKKGILTCIVLLLALPLLYRISQSGQQLDNFAWDNGVRKVVLMRLDAIIYGVLAAYAKYFHKELWTKHAISAFVVGILFMMIVSYIPRDVNNFYTKTVYLSLTPFAAMFFLPFADSVKLFKTKIGVLLTHISKISYSMYLINLGLVSQVISRHFPISSPSQGAFYYLIYWIIVLVVSTFMYYFIELHFLKMRDRSTPHKKQFTHAK